MAKQSVGNTALGAAICRLVEQYQPEKYRLFYDPVVKNLVGASIRIMMRSATMRNFMIKQTDATLKGLYGLQVCRTRYIDDAVLAALSQGIGQLVILGAGLDSRPYRLSGLEHVKVFEIDLPSVQEDKKKKLIKHLGRLPENLTYIPIDFDTQSLEEVFKGTAFDASKPAIFIWEGVTQYLAREAVRRTLAFVGRSAPGSIIVFTYVLKSIIERRSDIPGMNEMMDVVAKRGFPWTFGLEPSEVPAFLKPFHLSVTADVGSEEHQEKYLKPLGRILDVSECERIVQATVIRP